MNEPITNYPGVVVRVYIPITDVESGSARMSLAAQYKVSQSHTRPYLRTKSGEVEMKKFTEVKF